jgi:hypothetical protein
MRILKLIILSLTLFLSQGSYSLSIFCQEPVPLPLIPIIPLLSSIPFDSTEDELNKLMMEYELIMVGVGYSKFTYMPPSTRMLAPVT